MEIREYIATFMLSFGVVTIIALSIILPIIMFMKQDKYSKRIKILKKEATHVDSGNDIDNILEELESLEKVCLFEKQLADIFRIKEKLKEARELINYN